MKKSLLLLIAGLVLSGCGLYDSSDSNTFNLSYSAGESSTTISFDSGTYESLKVDQNYSSDDSFDWDYCADSDSLTCDILSVAQDVSGDAIDTISEGTLTSSITEITVDFEIDSDDCIMLISSETTCTIILDIVTCADT